MTISVGLFVFPDMELLSYAGPYQVFATASALAPPNGGHPAFRLLTIAPSAASVEVRAGATVLPQATIDDHLELSCLIIPGGKGVDAQIDEGRVVPWLAAQANTVPIIASVCTGAFLLAQTGLINGLRVATHHAHAEELRRRFPSVDVVESRRWVDTGRFVSSAGIAAGIDMALHLVERMAFHDLSVQTARHLELN